MNKEKKMFRDGSLGLQKSPTIRFLFVFIFIGLIFSACDSKPDEIDISHIQADAQIIRLEQEFFKLREKEEIIDFLNRHEGVVSAFFGFDPQSIEAVEQLSAMRNDPYMDTLYFETQRIFPQLDDISQELETAFKRVKYFFPDFQEPKIYTMISGLGSDMLVTDSMVVIGIDFFLGEDGKYRPVDVPNYILERYQKSYIVPALMLLLSDRFHYSDPQDNSMLAEMISYGKAYYFCQKVLPNTSPEKIIAYNTEQWMDIHENEAVIWSHFLDNKLLYESSHFIKNKYMGERPYIAEIGRRCPGRIGAWLGWRIVDSYMKKNPQTSLDALMEFNPAGELFLKSGYRPGK